MRPWSKLGFLFFLFAIALVVVPADSAYAWEDEDEGGGDESDEEGGGTSDCGPIDPDSPCYSGGGGGTQTCTGIGGCNNCVRDPFTLNYKQCKFTDDQDGVCKCWANGPGTCGTSGTCTYIRFGGCC